MEKFKIENIGYALMSGNYEKDEENSVGFVFTKAFADDKFTLASLQLPTTEYSNDTIDDIDYDDDNEEHVSIFNQLSDYYFSDFCSFECAATSAEICSFVCHVEEVGNYFVAFASEGEYVLEEAEHRSYDDDRALFSFASDIDDDEYEEIINSARKSYFLTLIGQLKTYLQAFYETVIINDSTALTTTLIKQYFDKTLHEFMKEKFMPKTMGFEEIEFENGDIVVAQQFYEECACVIRCDFERKALEFLESK